MSECHRMVNLPKGTVGYSTGWEVLVLGPGGQGYLWGQMHAGYCPACGKYLAGEGVDRPEGASGCSVDRDDLRRLIECHDGRGKRKCEECRLADSCDGHLPAMLERFGLSPDTEETNARLPV